MFGMSEYLMIAHEVEKARQLSRKAREDRRGKESASADLPPDRPIRKRGETEMSKAYVEQGIRLDEMDEREAHHFLTGLLSNLDPEEEYNVRHETTYWRCPSRASASGAGRGCGSSRGLPDPATRCSHSVAPGAGQGGSVGR